MKICIDSPVSTLRGVGPAKSASLAAAGIVTIKDLLHYYPRAYQNKADIKTLADAAVLCSQPLPAEPGGAALRFSSDRCRGTYL